MKVTVLSAFACECGGPMMVDHNDGMWCFDTDCEHHGKRFKRPTIELEEIQKVQPL